MTESQKLKNDLVAILGWDVFVVEGIVAAIEGAATAGEVDDYVENFMGNNAAARKAVQQFMSSRHGNTSGSQAASQAAPPNAHRTVSQAVSFAAATAPAQQLPSTLEGGWKLYHKEEGALSGKVGRTAETDSQTVRSNAAPKGQPRKSGVGLTIKMEGSAGQAGKKKVSGASGVGGKARQAAARPAVEKQVVNCLCCGKIFDCRQVNDDTIMFLESDGHCTFCGAKVALRYAEQSQTNEQLRSQSAPADPSGPSDSSTAAGSTSQLEGDERAAAAVALKNRLVDYDRNSAKRTNVIDDQSDYYEIDSNSWLSEEERAELKRRQREIEEAEASRKGKVVVTFDLLGRQVLMSDDAPPETPDVELAETASLVAQLTKKEYAQGGGRAAGAAQAVAEKVDEQLARMRISANPTASFTPLFVDATVRSRGDEASAASVSTIRHDAGSRKTHSKPTQGSSRASKQPQGRPTDVSRLQHEDPLWMDQEAARKVDTVQGTSEDGQAFDICPPLARPGFVVVKTRKPKGSQGEASGSTDAVQVLADGLVLLKGWIKLEDQVKMVEEVRQLGLGQGGFYIPSYADGGQLSLHMMCLGQHWEPRTSSYEATRSSYDGAHPPPLPPSFVNLAQQSLAAASAHLPKKLPGISPDVCLVNFYEKSGRLGLHQDKDEQPETLRRGIPVVSFSLGDAADFVYSRSRDETQAQTVRLESGDVLIFGGASRMLFHAVPSIHPLSAPHELTQRTGLRPGRLNLTFRQVKV